MTSNVRHSVPSRALHNPVIGEMALDALRAGETADAFETPEPATLPLEAPAFPSPYLLGKRALDMLGSALLLLLLSPVLAVVALAIRQGGGPVFFAQPRVGRYGRTFYCYKFRSMVPDAEHALKALLEKDPQRSAEWKNGQKLQQDPRITRIGRILRKTSLDELPQLWNVLVGDMSLIGPRPVMLSQIVRYGRDKLCYTAMRPGITGLWQVTARGDRDFARRVQLDCDYVRTCSFALDVRILLRTVAVVLSGRGAI